MVCLSESKWIMSATVALTLGFGVLGHLLLTVLMLRKNGHTKYFEKCVDVDDFYEKVEDEEDVRRFHMKQILKVIMHNFDMASDWLYYLTVPAYTQSIKIMLLITVLFPVISILILKIILWKGFKFLEMPVIFFGLYPLYSYHVDNIKDRGMIEGKIEMV